jgi:Protein of unknown function (DUF3489)
MLSSHEENIMAKLTDTQLIVLSNAAARDDGIAVVPNKMNKAAASKVAASLVARKLMREVRSKPGMPVWREDEDDRSISLMIMRAGRDAIGVDDEAAEKSPPASKKDSGSRRSAAKEPFGIVTTVAPRAGTKQAQVIQMLSAKTGATLEALVDATGWLPHTTRAALTALRKRGFSIERSRDGNDTSIYRIVTGAKTSAGT